MPTGPLSRHRYQAATRSDPRARYSHCQVIRKELCCSFWATHEAATSMLHGFLPIVEQVVRLAWQVWTRKARLDALAWSDLPDQQQSPGTVVYSASSDKLELHSMHNKEVDDDTTALDGYECFVLCSPVVLLAGNAAGKEYDKKRVVRKGVVWLG